MNLHKFFLIIVLVNNFASASDSASSYEVEDDEKKVPVLIIKVHTPTSIESIIRTSFSNNLPSTERDSTSGSSASATPSSIFVRPVNDRIKMQKKENYPNLAELKIEEKGFFDKYYDDPDNKRADNLEALYDLIRNLKYSDKLEDIVKEYQIFCNSEIAEERIPEGFKLREKMSGLNARLEGLLTERSVLRQRHDINVAPPVVNNVNDYPPVIRSWKREAICAFLVVGILAAGVTLYYQFKRSKESEEVGN